MIHIDKHEDYIEVTATFYRTSDGKGHDKFICKPRAMRWRSQDIVFVKTNLSIPTKKGERMIHRFYVNDGANTYGIEFDAQFKCWKLTETLEGVQPSLEEWLADEKYAKQIN